MASLGRPNKQNNRPNSARSTLNRRSIATGGSGGSTLSHASSLKLDPQVDMRAAVRPSLVKRKKNAGGILFSLNTMLYRKVEKMSKDQQRKQKPF